MWPRAIVYSFILSAFVDRCDSIEHSGIAIHSHDIKCEMRIEVAPKHSYQAKKKQHQRNVQLVHFL